MKKNIYGYAIAAAIVLFLDRSMKWYALYAWADEQVLTPFLSFQLAFNRGISWGIFNSASALQYALVTLLIVGVTIGLCWYTYKRYISGQSILGELLVITGSCSNILDRFFYDGVIDFIMVHNGSWVWPLFNIADSCIVLGIALMVFNAQRVPRTCE